MNIAITGHSGGLGAALFVEFMRHQHEVQGFSLPDYDITKPESRLRIMTESASADVFINCAHSRVHHDMSQALLFSMMYQQWKDVPKHIINIGSIIPSMTCAPFIAGRSEYRAAKAALDAIADESAVLRNRCRVTTIRPDWMVSDELRKLEAEYGRKAPNPLEYEDVAKLVYQLVEWGDTFTVTSISLKGSIT